MKLTGKTFIDEFCLTHPEAKSSSQRWHDSCLKARWKNFAEVRGTFNSADSIKVSSGRNVVIFNIGKKYRLIAAIDFARERIMVLKVMPHDEYDRQDWKNRL